MNTKPFIGQRVCLNDVGYATLHLTSAEAIRQSTDMRVTDVQDMSTRGGVPIWAIDVDQPLVNVYLLDAIMVDPL